MFVVKSPAGGETREGPASSAASSFTAACIPQRRGAQQWRRQRGEGGTATTGHGTSHPIAGHLGVHYRGRDVKVLPPPARGSRGSYAAQLWSGLFLHLLIRAEVKPDPGKQARSAEINSPQQDKGTDLLTARAAAFPQAQQQLPRSSPETCTSLASHRERPPQQPGTPLVRITPQKPQLGVFNQIYRPNHFS